MGDVEDSSDSTEVEGGKVTEVVDSESKADKNEVTDAEDKVEMGDVEDSNDSIEAEDDKVTEAEYNESKKAEKSKV